MSQTDKKKHLKVKRLTPKQRKRYNRLKRALENQEIEQCQSYIP
jgi:GrpB-like predicted nucleotidyltransferase (UPF0157 family)